MIDLIARVRGLASRTDPHLPVIEGVRRDNLTSLAPYALLALSRAVRAIERHDIPGALIAVGNDDGGVTVVIAAAKSQGRPFTSYLDSDPASADDGPWHVRVALSFFNLPHERNRVTVVPGRVADTLHLHGPVALAFVGVDDPDAAMLCLDRIHAQIVPGGRFVIDDHIPAMRATMDAFLVAHPHDYRTERRTHAHLVRKT